MVRMALLYPLKIAALAAIFWQLIRGHASEGTSVILPIVLALFFHLAVVVLLTASRRLGDAKLVKNSLRGELPREGKRIALAGTIEAEGELLRTPFGGVPCILYSYEIYRMVSPRASGSKSSSTETRVTDFSGLALTSSVIRTSSGRFALNGFPFVTGGVKVSGREQLRGPARDYILRTAFARTLPMAGELAAVDKSMVTPVREMRVDWQMHEGDELEDATFDEEYVPDSTRACALGIYSAAARGLIPGRGAEQRIRLIVGDGATVVQGLIRGARYSQFLAALVLLIIAGVLSFILFWPDSLLERLVTDRDQHTRHVAALR